MEPAFLNNGSVLVSSIPYLFAKPKIGEVVALKKKDKIFIKRIVKIRGEKCFVKGDNAGDSMDSRRIGWISKKNIVGKVIVKM